MAEGRILLVNDNGELSIVFREKLMIEAGFTVSVATGAQEAMDAFRENGFSVVVVNFEMRDLNREALVRDFKKLDPGVVIIASVGQESDEISREAVRLGIYALISQPLNEERLLFLVKKGVELHSLAVAYHKLTEGLKEQNAALQKQNSILTKRLEESTKNLTRLYEDLRSTYMRTIKALAQTIDARDHYTHSHSENVAKFAVAMAEEMRLPAKDIEIIREACELHDLGKIGIPDNILIKPAALTNEEWQIMRRHPITGAQILEPLTFLHSVIDLIRQHHEHYDGTGYPKGLKGEEIPVGARIIHLADAYEAMTSARSYRKVPLTKDAAIQEIVKHRGTQFDPQIVDVFLRIVNTF